MKRPIEIVIDGGRTVELSPDNHGVAMFRETPEQDYLDITEYEGDEEAHTLIYNHRWFCLWLGRVCIQKGDTDIVEALEEENGTAKDRTGWNSTVIVEDRPSEFENEMFTDYLLLDLNRTEGVPDDFTDL